MLNLENQVFDVNTKSKIKVKAYLNWGFVCPKCKSINMAMRKQNGKITCLFSGCHAEYEDDQFKKDNAMRDKIRSILSGGTYKTSSGLTTARLPPLFPSVTANIA